MIGNPMQGPRVVPFGEARKASDVLPNGHPGPRVTQRFGDWDAYFRDRIHGAMDIGNFYCGDILVAPFDAYAVAIGDPNGAKGVRFTKGSLVVEYWHLSRVSGVFPRNIRRGSVAGYIGSSGLTIGMQCHCHITASTDGGKTWRDPWPLLDQNMLPDTSTRRAIHSDMKVRGYPNIRSSPGGTIVGTASTGQRYIGRWLEKAGPTYYDPWGKKNRRDWVGVERSGKIQWIAKAFIYTVRAL